MRKKLIVVAYFLCAAAYTLIAVIGIKLMQTVEYDTTSMSILNKAMGFSFGLILISLPLLLVSKGNRKAAKSMIAAVVDDFMYHTYGPLKSNIKRKEFWILQGYVLTRILAFFNKFFFMVYVFPVVLFMVDSSKEVGAFAINFVLLMICVNIVRIILSAIDSNWERCAKQALSVAILVPTTSMIERMYQATKIMNTSGKAGGNELIIFSLIIGYILALRFVRNWILNSIEKDITIERNPLFDRAVFGIPTYSFKKYEGLIKIETIDMHYLGFNDEPTNSYITFVGHIRYGILKFEMQKKDPIISTEVEIMEMIKPLKSKDQPMNHSNNESKTSN